MRTTTTVVSVPVLGVRSIRFKIKVSYSAITVNGGSLCCVCSPISDEEDGEIEKRGRKGKQDRRSDDDEDDKYKKRRDRNRSDDRKLDGFQSKGHPTVGPELDQLTHQVLVKESSHVRTITLNRPKQLNALSFKMISRLLELFHAYEENPYVKLIIMKGEERAFCVRGDVAAVVQDINQG
ncbi:hypothetical protein L2E82_01831 [Cichorium intybus]|uniref:Uncharacterized protein n=1 Tax=Cichorium intybus TaxID=13427 RepID=A0ACB9GZX9_CICIN|nr:hypothetical protein L2E82_01831 [Cichorium intybus]